MARLRNAAGVIMSVADERATRLRDYGWEPAEAEKADADNEKPKASSRRRSAKKSD